MKLASPGCAASVLLILHSLAAIRSVAGLRSTTSEGGVYAHRRSLMQHDLDRSFGFGPPSDDVPCGDHPPVNSVYSCDAQKAFGKCYADFIKEGDFCRRTCGRCDDVCNDVAPPGQFTCADQKKFGKCEEAFVRDWGFCALTCGKCNDETYLGGASSNAAAKKMAAATQANEEAVEAGIEAESEQGDDEEFGFTTPAGTVGKTDMPAGTQVDGEAVEEGLYDESEQQTDGEIQAENDAGSGTGNTADLPWPLDSPGAENVATILKGAKPVPVVGQIRAERDSTAAQAKAAQEKDLAKKAAVEVAVKKAAAAKKVAAAKKAAALKKAAAAAKHNGDSHSHHVGDDDDGHKHAAHDAASKHSHDGDDAPVDKVHQDASTQDVPIPITHNKEKKHHSKYVLIHGALMAIAFGLVIPLGVFSSRYGKKWGHWFNVHRAVQVLGYVIAASGFFLGLALHKLKHMERARLAELVHNGRRLVHDEHSTGHHSAAWLRRHKVFLSHKYLGIAIFMVLTLQIAAAIVRRPQKGSSLRAAWTWSHWLAGWGSLAAGLANCSTGLHLLQPISSWWIALTAAIVSSIIGVVAVMEIRRCIFGHRLEGYKQADEGSLEMVDREERQGLKDFSDEHNMTGDGRSSDADEDDELTMVTSKYVP